MSEHDLVTLSVNGRPHTLPRGSDLAQLVAALQPGCEAVATAVNGEFVARSDRAGRTLCDGDAVHCFQPIVGG